MRLVAYLRFSPRPVLRWSLEKQRQEILQWAAVHGHEVVAWFTDRAVSGDDGLGKVARSALVRSLPEHQAEGIVFADLSRWTREDAVEALYHINQLEKDGIRVFSAWEDFLNHPSEVRWIILLLVLSKNEMELKRQREDISRGVRLALEAGVWMGPVPLFYERVRSLSDEPDRRRVEGQNYGIKCAEPEKVFALYEGRLAGKSIAKLADEFGIRRDQVYSTLRRRQNIDVVGEVTWSAVQGIVVTQRQAKWYRSYLLTGLIVCPFCERRLGASLRIRLTVDGTATYRCANKAEPHVWRCISEPGITRQLLRYFDGFVLDAATRAEVLLVLRTPVERVRMTERQQAVAEIDSQRRYLEGAKKAKKLPDQMVAKNLAELDRIERSLPPEVALAGPVEREPLDLMCSLGDAIRGIRSEDYGAVQEANSLLRSLIQSITFAEGDPRRPIFNLKPEVRLIYDVLRSVIPRTESVEPSVEGGSSDDPGEARRLAHNAAARRYRQTERGRESLKVYQMRYRARIKARRQTLQRLAVDKRTATLKNP
jgi:DNA invertase Pin-like site-specific DNA recombinase